MEEWALDAAANGDFSGIKTEEVVLEIVERRRAVRLCPCCKKDIRFNFSRHLTSCSKGRACTLCHAIPENLDTHFLECTGNKFPCRVCQQIHHSKEERVEHELQCRRVNNNAHLERNVHPRPDPQQDGDIPTGEQSLGGLCRKIVLNPPPNCGSDFEGFILFSRDQLTSILEHFRG